MVAEAGEDTLVVGRAAMDQQEDIIVALMAKCKELQAKLEEEKAKNKEVDLLKKQVDQTRQESSAVQAKMESRCNSLQIQISNLEQSLSLCQAECSRQQQEIVKLKSSHDAKLKHASETISSLQLEMAQDEFISRRLKRDT